MIDQKNNNADLRKRAEEMDREKTSRTHEDLKNLSPEETQQVLHELRVHQIELEMQNDELRRSQVELETVKARYFDLYDLAPVGYCTISEKGLILEANLSAATLLGVPRGALTKQPISRFIFKEDQDIYYLRRKKLLETSSPQAYEIRIVKMDGTVFWARLEATTATDIAGVTVCRVMLSDITAPKKAEEILKRDKKTLEKMVKERSIELIEIRTELERAKRLYDIGTLAATVAHELRNPLFGISLATTVIRSKSTDNMIAHQVQLIDELLVESGQIIDNLLFYSQLKPPQHRTLDLHSLLEECTDQIRTGCSKKNIAVSKHIDSLKGVPISADPVQIREVFTNILNNSSDAVPDHGGEIDVKARVYRELVKIHITNNGPEIAKADLKKVFDPFFTTKIKGTGLGLTVCRQIVKMHGGFINIKSGKEKGTSVIITIPKTNPKRGNDLFKIGTSPYSGIL